MSVFVDKSIASPMDFIQNMANLKSKSKGHSKGSRKGSPGSRIPLRESTKISRSQTLKAKKPIIVETKKEFTKEQI